MHLLLGLLVGMLGLQQASRQSGALPIRLVGLVVNQAAPEKSVCLLVASSSGGTPVLAQLEDRIFEMAVVQAIDPAFVILRNLATNGIEVLGFGEAAQPLLKPAPAPAPAPPPAIAPEAPLEGERVIPKSVVDHYRANLKDFLDAATAAPRVRTLEGRSVIDGFEIRSVKSGSVVDQLGFRAGDVILTVNGTRLDGLDKVLSLYQASREATRIELTVLRDGKIRTVAFAQK